MPRRAYFGDQRLPTYLRGIVPDEQRGQTQIHQGVDRTTALVLPTSPNYSTRLMVTTRWNPEDDYSKGGFRAKEGALRSALRARSEAMAPVCWIEDDTSSTTVASFVGNVITTTANPNAYTVGDRVLIRRTGFYTVGTVSARTTSTITVVSQHTYAAADDILLIQAYWSDCVFDTLQSIPMASAHDSFTDEANFTFTTSGTTVYHRTSVSLE